MDEYKGSGPMEGIARGGGGAPHAVRKGGTVRSDGTVGADAGGPDAEGGRRRDFASAAGAGFEPEDSGEDPAEGGEAGAGQVRGFWADAGELNHHSP